MRSPRDITSKPPIRAEEVLEALRGRIVGGTWSPGMRIPNREDIQGEFGGGSATIQKALNVLLHDGFLVARGRAGTYVVDHPPHLTRYALVYQHRRQSDPFTIWSTAWTAMLGSLPGLKRGTNRRFDICEGIDGHADVEDYQRLLRDIDAQRLAGVIFGEMPPRLEETPLLSDSLRVPRAAFMSVPLHGIPVVTMDNQAWIDAALARLRERGRKRVAVLYTLTTNRNVDYFRSSVTASIAAHGLDTRQSWIVPTHPLTPMTMRAVTQLIMQKDAGDRPDAFLIQDDHLVEEATLGLHEAGVSAASDLEVIALCNFPVLPRQHVPVTFLGYEAGEGMGKLIELIDMQRRGERVPQTTLVRPRFARAGHAGVVESPGVPGAA